MKKTMISINGNSRKTYQKPSLDVCLLNEEQPLLAGSGEVMEIDTDGDWPTDSDTGLPSSPW